ncbi:MAG: hypothetical protein U5K28_00910 [Halobacteriales archaeon]|nr:hypothetical protein [Halobacteriales archaeon]
MDPLFIAGGLALFALVFGGLEFLDDILDRYYPMDEEVDPD